MNRILAQMGWGLLANIAGTVATCGVAAIGNHIMNGKQTVNNGNNTIPDANNGNQDQTVVNVDGATNSWTEA